MRVLCLVCALLLPWSRSALADRPDPARDRCNRTLSVYDQPDLPKSVADALRSLYEKRTIPGRRGLVETLDKAIVAAQSEGRFDEARRLSDLRREVIENFVLDLGQYAVTARGVDKIFGDFLDPEWKQLVLDRKGKVLDAGCGHGAMLFELMGKYKQSNVVGIDAQLSEGMPENFHKMDFSAMPAEFKRKYKDHFTVITATNTVFSYQGDGTTFIRQVLTEMRDVLAVGGSILVGPGNAEATRAALPPGLEIVEESKTTPSFRIVRKF